MLPPLTDFIYEESEAKEEEAHLANNFEIPELIFGMFHKESKHGMVHETVWIEDDYTVFGTLVFYFKTQKLVDLELKCSMSQCS